MHYTNNIAMCMCNRLKIGLSAIYLRMQKTIEFNLLESSWHYFTRIYLSTTFSSPIIYFSPSIFIHSKYTHATTSNLEAADWRGGGWILYYKGR
jgi:hypothetical protein